MESEDGRRGCEVGGKLLPLNGCVYGAGCLGMGVGGGGSVGNVSGGCGSAGMWVDVESWDWVLLRWWGGVGAEFAMGEGFDDWGGAEVGLGRALTENDSDNKFYSRCHTSWKPGKQVPYFEQKP